MDLFGKSPRPTFNDDMLVLLSEEIGKEICQWNSDGTSLANCVEDARDILKRNHYQNGYDLAKEFEDKGYSPDAQLVEILDSVDYSKIALVTKSVKKWVIEDKIEPPFEILTKVIVQYGHKKVEGTITNFHKETAEYLVCIESEGHSIDGSTRAVIKYENAETQTEQINK